MNKKVKKTLNIGLIILNVFLIIVILVIVFAVRMMGSKSSDYYIEEDTSQKNTFSVKDTIIH